MTLDGSRIPGSHGPMQSGDQKGTPLFAKASLPRRRGALALLLAAALLESSTGCETKPHPPEGPSPAPQPSAVAGTAHPTSEPSAAPPAAKEADNAIVIGERQTFRSTILGEDRTILVHTPRNYKQSTAAYPVLYLLDGDAHFHHTTGITTVLADTQRAPQMIVVGVANTVRDRDLTPTAMKDRPASGGGAKFLAFLEDELRQRIESSYRTVPYRILVGHSLGGLFAVHALVSAPGAFNAHVSISPSLWWDGEIMRREAEKLFAERADLQGFLYITVGDEPGRMLDGNRSFVEMLKAKAPRGLTWSFSHMERENHVTIPHRSTYDALEALFAGWEPPRGLLTLKALEAHFAALSKRFSYEVKIPEGVLNNFGYSLMEKHGDEAIIALQRNVELYPESANVYDSLGEAYEKSGELDLARTNYEMAVRKGTASADPALPIFKKNLERVSTPSAKP